MTTPPAAPLPFDARPLTEPVDKTAMRAHLDRLRSAGRLPRSASGIAMVLFVVIGVVFVLFFASTFVRVAVGMVQAAGDAPGGIGLLWGIGPFVILAIFLAGVGTLIYRMVRGGKRERWYRLDRFAQANGMAWHAEAKNPPLPGMIFALGRDRAATDIVRGEQPRFVEFGNYRYTTGSGKNQSTHRWGYIAVKLTSPLPHIVLDATGNNGLFGSNLPASFDRDQRLRLEGDFDRYFSLYCPQGYERDALYLFTPDIMARFIDNAAALDVEIVEDWMFLYAKREFSTLDPQTWAWLFSVVAALLDKFAQWERWRDDRLAAAPASTPFTAPATALRPPPGVAAPGRRLKRGIPWATVAVMGMFVVFFFLIQSRVLFW